MKKPHHLKKAVAAGVLGLAATFNAHAAPAATPPAPAQTVKLVTASWSDFLHEAQQGAFEKADIVNDQVAAFHTDKKTGAVTETDTRTINAQFAYDSLKGNVKNITFMPQMPSFTIKTPPVHKKKKSAPVPQSFSQKIKSDALSVLNATIDYLKMTLLPFLPFLGLMGLMIWLPMRRMAGRNKNNKNLRKPVNPQHNTTRFKDIAGQDDAKREVEEIISFLKNPKEFKKVGATCPRGCLLSGPPGTGKTLLAKAVAGEAGVPFYSVSGSDFVEMFVGVGAARVRDLFGAAKKQSGSTRFSNFLRRQFGYEPKMSPCIIYIDELDAIGKKRGRGMGGSNDEQENTLNQILIEMDGFLKEESNVIVLGSTNRPEMLDSALLRPGRFTRKVTVELPDIDGREAILKIHTRKKPLADDVDLREEARKAIGYSGADLENLANEAAILCARRDGDALSRADFREAKDKIDMGLAGKVTDDPMRKALTAYHEAGHTLLMMHEPDAETSLTKVTIVPRGASGGHAAMHPKEEGLKGTVGQLEARIRYAVAGRVAEEMIFGDNNVTYGASSDIRMATDVARTMIADLGMSKEMGMVKYNYRADGSCAESPAIAEKINALVKEKIEAAKTHTRRVLEANIDNLHRLAHELMDKETLDADEVGALVDLVHVEDPRTEGLRPGIGIKDVRRGKQLTLV